MTAPSPAHPPAAAGGRQPDRRRRGHRAAGLGRQGAGRERARRRRPPHRHHDRAGRQGAGARSRTTASACRRPTRELALQRHATSQDRHRRTTWRRSARSGFRGEALPSIASVSHFVLRTRERGSLSGTEIRVEGGTASPRARGGRARRHVRSRSATCSTTCRRAASSSRRTRRNRRRSRAWSRRSRSATSTSASR